MFTLFDQDRINELNKMEAAKKAAEDAACKERYDNIQKLKSNLKMSAEQALAALGLKSTDLGRYASML